MRLLLDLDPLDHHVLARTIHRAGRDPRDRFDHRVAVDDLTEYRVFAGEVRRGRDRDEELGTIRVRARVRHREETGTIERRSPGRTLVGERVAGTAAAGPLGIAALDPEVRDHAVEHGAV